MGFEHKKSHRRWQHRWQIVNIKIYIEVYSIMFDEKLKKAEGFILLQNNLMNAVFVKQATPVGDVEALTRYYKSQQTLSELFNEQMGWV